MAKKLYFLLKGKEDLEVFCGEKEREFEEKGEVSDVERVCSKGTPVCQISKKGLFLAGVGNECLRSQENEVLRTEREEKTLLQRQAWKGPIGRILRERHRPACSGAQGKTRPRREELGGKEGQREAGKKKREVGKERIRRDIPRLSISTHLLLTTLPTCATWERGNSGSQGLEDRIRQGHRGRSSFCHQSVGTQHRRRRPTRPF